MKQPMSVKEIAVWDAIATKTMAASVMPIFDGEKCKTVTLLESSDAYSYATRAIAARRVALIADAHVGEASGRTAWECRCIENERHFFTDEYCEACHTRRPDEGSP